MKIKNVVLVVQQKYCNLEIDSTNNFWGLGDIIRGLADLHELCLSLGWNCYADLTNHPIGNYLDCDASTKSPFEINKEIVPFVCDIETYINNNHDSETLFFFSNQLIHPINEKYNSITKQFIKKIFRPSGDLQKQISEKLQLLPNPFTILHFRVGDEDIVRQNSKFLISLYPTISNLYKKYSYNNLNPIVLSDSKNLRVKLLEDFSGVNTINYDDNTTLAHLGFHSNPEAIKNSMVEFFLATHATKIYGYTSYTGTFNVSGFVRMIGMIYDIGVRPMKLDS